MFKKYIIYLLELKRFIREHNITYIDKIRETDLILIITGDEMAYTRLDGVKIVPIGCLKISLKLEKKLNLNLVLVKSIETH